ncbi:6-phosphogluconate dehydrogenase [Mycobacteroides abscessus]|nr:6-phosphogluconate dehydrogenase [Mycobacteroides abscessus]
MWERSPACAKSERLWCATRQRKDVLVTAADGSAQGKAQIGVTGLAVMGSNIARNFARHGYTVALHNRSIAKTDALLAEHGSEGNFVRSESIEEFVAALERPRRVLIMVKAGDPTDAVINELADAMEQGDIIIDGGNSLYTDTIRREKAMADRGLHFVGAGISGGEEGALNGPSIMPEDRRSPMSPSARCWRRSRRTSTACPAAPTSAPMAPATS